MPDLSAMVAKWRTMEEARDLVLKLKRQGADMDEVGPATQAYLRASALFNLEACKVAEEVVRVS